jgi:outer membrane protein assembly factor BamE (lipoprotein component of BamABCDE complex)
VLIGCATIGKPINESQVSQLKDGVTTKQEVISIMGEPFDKTITDSGDEKWTYVYSVIQGRLTDGQVREGQKLEILFDTKNIIKKHLFLASTTQRPKI